VRALVEAELVGLSPPRGIGNRSVRQQRQEFALHHVGRSQAVPSIGDQEFIPFFERIRRLHLRTTQLGELVKVGFQETPAFP
jgi:hypothetical protein